MAEKRNIYESMAAAMAEVGAISKSSKNREQGFMYRGIDAVYNALQPALIKNKIFVLPEVLKDEQIERQTARGGRLLFTRLTVKYTFYAEDGTSVTATVVGEGMDSADKSSNKALSACFKYACFQAFCIPTEELIDADAETPPPSAPVQKAVQKPPVQSQNAPQAAKPAETNNQPLMSTEAAQALWTKLTAANVNINKLLAKYKVRSIVSLNQAQVAEIERLLEEFWNDNHGNAEPDHSGNSYVGAGFAEAV